MIKLVVFDMDGTLVDTMDGIAYSANLLMAEYGFKQHDRDFYSRGVGHGAKGLIAYIIENQGLDKSMLDELVDGFVRLYSEHCLRYNKIYDGMDEVVNHLVNKDVKIAINTNKPQNMAVRILSDLFDIDLFSDVRGACTDYPSKPSPIAVNMIMQSLKLKADDCVYIGDSIVDIDTAKNAGIKSICVTWGYGKSEDVKAADYVVSDAKEIINIIEKIDR